MKPFGRIYFVNENDIIFMTMAMTMATTMTMNIFYCHAYIEVTRHTKKHSP